MNTLFFSSCFIASLLLEGYAVQVLDGDILTTAGLGIVVLITGYLFVDSVRNGLMIKQEETKDYINQVIKDESDRWNERYSELVNLQKATYTATKKNKELFLKQFEDVLFKIETFENINASAQQKIMELQKKVMEGQKKALNLEVKYNKDNTNQILNVLQSEHSISGIEQQLAKILMILESNTQLIQDGHKNSSDSDYSIIEEPVSEEFNPINEVEFETPKVVPLYDDPNKALTTDEIAALFASFGQ